MPAHSKKNGIPDRWLDYRAVGKRLPGTRFIAFKVPLQQALNCNLQRADVFGPWELLDALQKENQELGLIIDLTFTTRYYKLQDIPDSWLYVKIFTAGHEIPSDGTILSFKRAVCRFLQDNTDNDKLIGVHCTHGLNRTGYLICRYLIDVDGMDPKEAVNLFNSSRGHAIERQNYLEDLQRGPKRSNEGMEETEQEPMRGLSVCRPCFSSDQRKEGRPLITDCWDHRTVPQRGRYHQLPQGGHPPSRPLLPLPPCRPFMEPRFLPYQRTSPYPDTQCRDKGRRSFPPQEMRTRGPYPHAPHYSVLPRYSPSTYEANKLNGYNSPDKWSSSMKTHYSHSREHRVKTYRDK